MIFPLIMFVQHLLPERLPAHSAGSGGRQPKIRIIFRLSHETVVLQALRGVEATLWREVIQIKISPGHVPVSEAIHCRWTIGLRPPAK